ncbi:MAG: beta-lactamase [Candidatus Solibacter sp.]|nr:beta-lactamase [Candidatus Solibacter sp.]
MMRDHKLVVASLLAAGALLAQQPDRFVAVPPRMQEFVDKGEAAGIVTLIATKGRIIHLSAVGKSDISRVARCGPTTSSGSRR